MKWTYTLAQKVPGSVQDSSAHEKTMPGLSMLFSVSFVAITATLTKYLLYDIINYKESTHMCTRKTFWESRQMCQNWGNAEMGFTVIILLLFNFNKLSCLKNKNKTLYTQLWAQLWEFNRDCSVASNCWKAPQLTFPAPTGPTTANSSPGLTVKERPCRVGVLNSCKLKFIKTYPFQ